MSDVAKAIDVSGQTVSRWLQEAMENKEWFLTALVGYERALRAKGRWKNHREYTLNRKTYEYYALVTNREVGTDTERGRLNRNEFTRLFYEREGGIMDSFERNYNDALDQYIMYDIDIELMWKDYVDGLDTVELDQISGSVVKANWWLEDDDAIDEEILAIAGMFQHGGGI